MSWQKWSYMDHWVTRTPNGLQRPTFSRDYMDRYLRQLGALGFRGFDTFGFSLPAFSALYGSLPAFESALRDHGFDKISGIFTAYPYATQWAAPDRAETHARILADCEATVRAVDGLQVENFIVMPSSTYFQSEPVTDDSIKTMADLWNRVGAMTADHGMKVACHFEFWGAIRTREQLDVFFEHADPELVFFFCDTAQHTIAGVDPLELFRSYRERCVGFHFKDTHDIDDHDAYRTPPDAELLDPKVPRWFYEMGTEGGLVDFPAIMREVVSSGYDGWLTVEHDKATIGGGGFAEATCVAKWYIDNVLAEAENDVLIAQGGSKGMTR